MATDPITPAPSAGDAEEYPMARGTAREDASPATIARARLAKLQAELDAVRSDTERLETQLNTAREKADDGRINDLRVKRDGMMLRQTGLAQDVVWAERALRTAEETELLQAVERDRAALTRTAEAIWADAEPALRAVAALMERFRTLEAPRHRLHQNVDACQQRFGRQVDGLDLAALFRLPMGFLHAFEVAEIAVERIDQHRAWLGDAATAAEADRRWQEQWRQERLAQMAKVPSEEHTGNRTVHLGTYPNAAAMGFR